MNVVININGIPIKAATIQYIMICLRVIFFRSFRKISATKNRTIQIANRGINTT